MANISVRRENGTQPAAVPAPVHTWEPFRLLRDLMNWDPFLEMAPVLPRGTTAFAPSFEVKETKDGYVFKADVPGVKESDLEVSVTGNRLIISGRREADQHEQSETFFTFERAYGEFARTFTLPDGVDTNSITAELRDGVLSVQLKKSPETQAKKVAIQTGGKKS